MKILKNYVWTLVGLVPPFLIAIVTIPNIVNKIGFDRFGILSICWIIFGFISMFDLGVSKILIREISTLIEKINKKEISDLFWSSLTISCITGFIYSLILIIIFICSKNYINYQHPDLNWELIFSLCFAFPIILSGQILKSLFDGLRLFSKSSLLQSINSSSIFIGPVFVVYSDWNDLAMMIISILIIRLVGFLLLYYFFARNYINNAGKLYSYIHINILLSRSVSSMLSSSMTPVFMLSDKILIGTMISSEAVGIISASSELVSRVFGSLGLVGNILYPEFCIKNLKSIKNSYKFFILSSLILLSIILIVWVMIIIGLDYLNEYIYGKLYIDYYKNLLIILSVGYGFNGLAQIPVMYLYSKGLNNIIAMIQVTEILFFIPILYFFILKFGLIGAAVAFSSRLIFDCLALYYYSIFHHYRFTVFNE